MSVRFNQKGFDARDFGAKGDGIADDAPAIQAMIDAMSPASPGLYGRRAYVPAGTYKLNSTIHIQRSLILEGEHGAGWFASTIFKPAKGVTAFIVDRYNTSVDGGRGDWSILRDFAILGTSTGGHDVPEWEPSHVYVAGDLVTSTGTGELSYLHTMRCTVGGTSGVTEPDWAANDSGDTQADGSVTWVCEWKAGIQLHARARLESLYIVNACGNGILIAANSGWTPGTNANNFRIDNCLISNSALNGLFIIGADANAGNITGCDFSNNRLWGVRDQSFLGNNYLGCHTADNGDQPGFLFGGAYSGTDLNACGVWAGLYSEGGQGPTDIRGPSMMLGGLHGAGFADTNEASRINSGAILTSSTMFIDPRTAGSNPDNVRTFVTGSGPYAINFTSDNEPTSGFTLGDNGSADLTGWWVWRHANLDARNFMAWSGNNASVGPGKIWFPAGFYLGGVGLGRLIFESRGTKPTTSAWSLPLSPTGSFGLNYETHVQENQNGHGIFGWQNIGQGTPNAIAIQTIRWPHWGHSNVRPISANGSGSPFAVDLTEYAGCVFTNTGATAEQYLALGGTSFAQDHQHAEISGLVTDADGMRFVAPASHTIRYGDVVSASAGYIRSTKIGSFIKLKLIGAVWTIVSFSGEWVIDGTILLSEGAPSIVTLTATATLTAYGRPAIVKNTGAGARTDFTLPATLRVGDTWEFVNDTANGLRVVANTGQTIVQDGNTSASAGYNESLTEGSTIVVTAISTTKVQVRYYTGNWDLN